ncbi:MAG: hypothetical protein Q8K43_02060 [Sulfurimicrobium sp.]|nr:hypothetical protein [Sulfurimicrobium sp.]MDP1704338.1 hypothetical protein [Sulfurimicrobium sp.]MDP1896650.1 hypothetical protein [Sulfurimicrobium sp.]MDP2200317.1 hypothetical protein [Sulfurimicrobium sp.]MDP3687808.1 hypothetical protein [Sulfurimicrobium sp.]
MSILVNIVSADEDDVEAVGESQHPVAEWSGIEARDIDTAKIVTLHCLLTGEGLEDAFYAYEPVYVAGDEGPIVLRIPDVMMEKLAGLEEDALEIVGEELAATEEFELNNWPLEEVQSLVEELAALARLAESQDQVLFVWMHPLLT